MIASSSLSGKSPFLLVWLNVNQEPRMGLNTSSQDEECWKKHNIDKLHLKNDACKAPATLLSYEDKKLIKT